MNIKKIQDCNLSVIDREIADAQRSLASLRTKITDSADSRITDAERKVQALVRKKIRDYAATNPDECIVQSIDIVGGDCSKIVKNADVFEATCIDSEGKDYTKQLQAQDWFSAFEEVSNSGIAEVAIILKGNVIKAAPAETSSYLNYLTSIKEE